MKTNCFEVLLCLYAGDFFTLIVYTCFSEFSYNKNGEGKIFKDNDFIL